MTEEIREQIQSSRVERLLKEYEQKQQQKKNKNPPLKKQSCISYLRQNGQRKWLCQKGKGYLIDFNKEQRSKMRDFFKTLDKKGCGQIGLDQLEQMLISLGLAYNLQEVKRLMGTVDEDQSGKIQFEQFLRMIQDDDKENANIVNFFKELVVFKIQNSGKDNIIHNKKLKSTKTKADYAKQQLSSCPKNIPFEMITNQITRDNILASLNIGRCKSPQSDYYDRIGKGKKVVTALQKMQERRTIRALRGTMSLCKQ